MILAIMILLLYFSDNLPTVRIKSWSIEASLFDGDLLGGPVPTLFGNDEEGAINGIKGDVLKCHWDLVRIHKAFFMPENLGTEEAIAVCKKPRYYCHENC